MVANFKFNDVTTLSFNLTPYKDKVLEIAKKYINKELNNENDENGAGGFWDLADEIITSNMSFVWKFSWSCDLQDFLYMKLKEYAREVIKELI